MPFKPFSSQKAHTERPPMPPIPTPPPPPPKTPPPAAAAAAYLCLPNDFDRCYQQVRIPGDAEEPNEVRGEPTSVLTTRNHQRSSGLSDSPTHLHTIQRQWSHSWVCLPSNSLTAHSLFSFRFLLKYHLYRDVFPDLHKI